MIGTLYRVELYKTVKRLASWVAFFSLAALIIFHYGGLYYDAWRYPGEYFGFPDAWPAVLGDSAGTVTMFAAVLVALVTGSEFDFRTSRQNLIDGLSRTQWFGAKLLLVPTIVLAFYGFQVLFACILAYIGTDAGSGHGFSLGRVQVLAGAGAVVGMLGYSCLALFVALLVRGAGAALGITLAYALFETLTAGALRGLELERIAGWLPLQVGGSLFQYRQYLPPGMADPDLPATGWDTAGLFAAGCGWIMLFVAASWLVYRGRDL